MDTIKKIGVLTSGGDAPGMNAAIRAVVRSGIYHQLEVYGIKNGYAGLLDGDLVALKTTDVSNIIQRGGTMLKTARCEAFYQPEGRAKAMEQLKTKGLDALIVIGGDGTFKGALALYKEFNFPVIGIPGTIDNDIKGTHYTIGFDTAVNTAVGAIDKIRDTASAHNRIFIVEVMGRDSGYLALHSGISCGAEDILIPEKITNVASILEGITEDRGRHKLTRIIVVTEGDDLGGAKELEEIIRYQLPQLDIRTIILGHIQRGGSPTAFDRMQASRLGFHAVEALLSGHRGEMLGVQEWAIKYIPFEEASRTDHFIKDELIRIGRILSL